VLDAEGKRSCARQVDDAFQDGTLTTPVPYSKAAQLPYLQACIKESLRLHPPISMELPRIVPEEGMLLCGKFVPGGTSVGCSPYIVHRQKEAYGEDAEEFRPERWIEADRAEKEGGDGGETRRRLERFYFTFGGSTTSCIVSPVAAGCSEHSSF
jgi:cytochrome P450